MTNSKKEQKQKKAAHEYRGARTEIEKMRNYNSYLNLQVTKLWEKINQLQQQIDMGTNIMEKNGLSMHWRC